MASLQLLLCCATIILIVNALEISPELLSGAGNEPSAGSMGKLQYTQYPLVNNEVTVDVDSEDILDQLPQPTRERALPPPWEQFVDEPVQQARAANKESYVKLPNNGHSHKHAHGHPLGHSHGECTIEITSKVPGVCEAFGGGSACQFGDFMEFYTGLHCTNS